MNSENELHRGSHDQGFLSLPGRVLVMSHSSPLPWDRTLCFLLFLPYVVPPELSWRQVHDGSHSNHNTNDIMTLKLGKGQVPGHRD